MGQAESAENTSCDCASHEVIEDLQNDHSYSGKTFVKQAGENLIFNDLCYVKSDGKLWKADADAAATMPGIYMALATIAADASGLFLRSGFVRDDSWDWTVGGIIFASTAPGALTQDPPSEPGDQKQIVGIAHHANRVDFNPSLILEEVPA